MNFFGIGPSTKATAALLIFIAGCLLSSARIFYDAPSVSHPAVDEVAERSDMRFAALKTALPSRGVIGYIGESGDSALPDYYLAQYALAPVVLDRGIAHRLVIGNFPNSTAAKIPPGLSAVRDFGNGIILLTNEGGR